MEQDSPAGSGQADTRPTTLLRELLRERYWLPYRRFCREYDKVARKLDKQLVGTRPSESTYKRWISGRLSGPPRAEASAVLQAMFPEHTIEQLFAPPTSSEPKRSTDSSRAQVVSDATLDIYSDGLAGEYRDPNKEDTDVNRWEFIAGLLAAATAPRRALLGESPHIDAGYLSRCRMSLNQLYSFDDLQGASKELYSLTVRSLRQMSRLLQTAHYSSSVENELKSITGEMAEHAGWLAFDSGRHCEARYWWLEALHMARLTDSPGVEVVAYASLSLQASQRGAREAAELAQAAQSAARRRQTPRLMSLLYAREAVGHALVGDRASARRTFRAAHRHVAGERHDDDPLWLDFWGPADLAWHETLAGGHLDDQTLAEGGARTALSEVDQIAYPRNHVLYSLGLAAALSAQGRFDEAAPLITDAVTRSADLHSDRAKSSASSLLGELSGRTDVPVVRELVDWALSNQSMARAETGFAPWST